MLAVKLRALHVASSAGQSNVVYAPRAGLYSQLAGVACHPGRGGVDLADQRRREEKWMPRVWPSRRPSDVPLNQDPPPKALSVTRNRLLKSCTGAQPCLPPCAHKPAQCRRLPATDTVLTFPVSPMLRAHIHARAPALAHGDALGRARARAKCAPGASKPRTRGFYSSRARRRQMTGEGSKIPSPSV